MIAEIVDGILAFLGAGIGSALAYLATRAEREARRREEWGRRLTTSWRRSPRRIRGVEPPVARSWSS